MGKNYYYYYFFVSNSKLIRKVCIHDDFITTVFSMTDVLISDASLFFVFGVVGVAGDCERKQQQHQQLNHVTRELDFYFSQVLFSCVFTLWSIHLLLLLFPPHPRCPLDSFDLEAGRCVLYHWVLFVYFVRLDLLMVPSAVYLG